MKRLIGVLFGSLFAIGCSSAPEDPVDTALLGTSQQALCAGGITLSSNSEVITQMVAENEREPGDPDSDHGNRNYSGDAVMVAGQLGLPGTGRRTYIAAPGLPQLSTLSSATWTFYPGPVNQANPGFLTLSTSAGAWNAGTLDWNNQPGPLPLATQSPGPNSKQQISGAEPQWSFDATWHYQAVLFDGITDNGLVLTKTGAVCTQDSDCTPSVCGSNGFCAGSATQMWSTPCVADGDGSICSPPVLTLCP